MQNKIRVQFEFSKESLDKFDALVKHSNSTTRAELIRKAITLYSIMSEGEQREAVAGLKEKDGTFSRVII